MRQGRFRARKVAVDPFRAANPLGYCAHHATGGRLPCVRYGTPHRECEIMGPDRLPTREFATMIVRNGTSTHGMTREQAEIWIASVIDWICAWGDCLWHAVWEVRGRTGYCACTPCVRTRQEVAS